MSRLVSIVALAFAFAAPIAVAAPPEAVEISADRIKAHVAFLADDLLEGRGAGARGEAIAANYVVSEFRQAGLEPAGANGSYLQPVPLQAMTVEEARLSIAPVGGGRATSFTFAEDFLAAGTGPSSVLNAEAVFVGYGLSTRDFGVDDYQGLDVRGKVVVAIGHPAPFLPPAEAAHFRSNQSKIASDHGAIGLIRLWTPTNEAVRPFATFAHSAKEPSYNWVGPDGAPFRRAPNIEASGVVRGAAADALFAGAPKSFATVLEEGKTGAVRGFALPVRVNLSVRSKVETGVVSANVAGLLPGSDPKLSREIVVVTAHYDHEGIGRAVNGDSIYNGAVDNAVGTAAIIEAAQEIASGPRPKRSLLFLAVGAEEKGLLGSDYFAERPTVAADRIVANVNADMPLPFYDFADIIGFGSEQSELGERLAAGAKELGVTIMPDPFPEQTIFVRSDNYSFARRGVPSLGLFTGFTNTAGEKVGMEQFQRFITNVYHKPNDDLSQPIDYKAAAKFADVIRRFALQTANTPARPRWHSDSIFAPEGAERTGRKIQR